MGRRPYGSYPVRRTIRSPGATLRQKAGSVMAFAGLVLVLHSFLPIDRSLLSLCSFGGVLSSYVVPGAGLVLCVAGFVFSAKKAPAAIGLLAVTLLLAIRISSVY